ncbi:WD40 repeat domain-containing protein [Pedobacter sp. UBA4863]|uniref:WD40 repeat domain-containing protein n=1 Tax=Pedobacter sp. UBA4863 TaxID=1947060 RepID=UPI0025E1C6AB|nr:WD40 repeat domain-containing protein [Pedobacter sp. UBA4863]
MLKHLHTFTGHQNPVYALVKSDKEGIFFTAGNDKGVVEWSLNKMAFVMVKMPVQSSVYYLHNYNNQLFIAERSGAFSVFDFIKQEVIARVNAHPKPIFAMTTLAQKKELLTSSEDGTVAIWSLHDFKELYKLPISSDTVRCMAVSPDEKEIAFGCKDGTIHIYNSHDYSLKQILTEHTLGITALAYHPKGEYLISGSRDAQLKVWRLPNYELSKNIPAHLFGIYDIVFHPSLALFATASQDKSIKLWDAENFKLYKIINIEKMGIGHSHSINKLTWSHDGSKLISTGDDKKVMVWELES